MWLKNKQNKPGTPVIPALSGQGRWKVPSPQWSLSPRPFKVHFSRCFSKNRSLIDDPLLRKMNVLSKTLSVQANPKGGLGQGQILHVPSCCLSLAWDPNVSAKPSFSLIITAFAGVGGTCRCKPAGLCNPGMTYIIEACTVGT